MTSQYLALVGSYVLGAIPFGFIVVKLLAGKDVRGSGSGSTGATNVTRSAGLKAGLLTYVLDVAKGATAVSIMHAITDDPWWLGAAALGAIVGHMFPVFLGFKGGKGVATGVGAYLVVVPFAVLSVLVVWIVLFKLTRIVSLASLAATACVPVFVGVWYALLGTPAEPVATAGAVSLGCLLVIAKHHENIGRLIRGTENRFERGSRDKSTPRPTGPIPASAEEPK